MYSFEIDRDELGRRLGGGVAEGTITLIEGEDGSGKSILSQRMAYGFLVNGHTVTYITTELTYKDFMAQMMSLRYNVLPYILQGKLRVFPVFPSMAGKIRKKRDYIERLINSPVLFETEITIVDTITMMLPEAGIPEKTVFDFLNFLKKMIAQDKAIIITADPEATDEKLLEPLREIADNYLIMKAEQSAEDIKNVIMVQRWKRTEREVTKVIKFRVEPKFGIVIDISSFAI